MFRLPPLGKINPRFSSRPFLYGSCLLLLASVLAPAVPGRGANGPDPGASGTDLLSVYQKGEIAIIPGPGFGKGTDWKDYLGDERLGLAVAPDGGVFVTQMIQNACLKFDAAGRFVTRFGKPGQGPGDLNHPSRLDILNGRSLAVMEGSESRRISVFSLEGKFLKLFLAENPVFGMTALNGRTIAYMTYRLQPKGPFLLKKSRVILKDLETGGEKAVCGGELFRPEDQVFSALAPNPPKIDYAAGDLIVERTRDGDLLVGFTTSPTVVVFDAAGNRLKSIDLNMPAVPFTDEILAGYRESVYRDLVEGVDHTGQKGRLPQASRRRRRDDAISAFSEGHPGRRGGKHPGLRAGRLLCRLPGPAGPRLRTGRGLPDRGPDRQRRFRTRGRPEMAQSRLHGFRPLRRGHDQKQPGPGDASGPRGV